MLDSVLTQLPLFEGLTDEQRAWLKPLFRLLQIEAGRLIFPQGGVAEYLYIVVEGEVTIQFKPDDGAAIDVNRIRTGEVFGWSAAFGNGFYTSSAVCTADSVFLQICSADLRKLCETHPDTGILLLERFANVVAQRWEGSRAQVVSLLEHALQNGVKPIGG